MSASDRTPLAHLSELRGAGEGSRPSSPVAPDGPMFTPAGDERCGVVKDACSCSLPLGHDSLHRCPHGWWRGEESVEGAGAAVDGARSAQATRPDTAPEWLTL